MSGRLWQAAIASLLLASGGCSAKETPRTEPLPAPDRLDMKAPAAARGARAGDHPGAGPVEAPPALPPCKDGDTDPHDLRCTGLYSDFGARTVAAGVREFKPAFELWSDGAEKTRWIYLPPGSTIDVSRMNDWSFPVGTRLWKEFRLPVAGAPRRIETRLLWKTAEDRWTRATYAWSEDGARALQVKAGVPHVPGTDGYAIPAQVDCIRCHAGKTDNPVGFEAIQLAAPEASGLTYAELVQRGLLSTAAGGALPGPGALDVPGSATERRALGLLHANCGVSCHHPLGVATHFEMRLNIDASGRVGDVRGARVYQTAINQPSKLRPPGAPPEARYYRIRPLDPDRSTLLRAMARRDAPGAPPEQMPPLATRRVDEAGVAAVRAWIEAMTPAAGYPPAAP
ncbi:hypothetical protein [Sorangium cellulosum]|uniref:Cytochrome c domain-containing protein n=1 Tax=Sorangium cellulosum TaxID=56 RepID=A0A150QEC5_SORCE|nr:hypothetical protein [Sorangium cellulosum]KYF66344.1 hypothetical protein BE15_24960 [Sorangium cellulosum]